MSKHILITQFIVCPLVAGQCGKRVLLLSGAYGNGAAIFVQLELIICLCITCEHFSAKTD